MRHLPIAKQGLSYITALAVLLLIFVVLGWTFVAGLMLIATVFVTAFFRDPERVIPQIPHHAVLAPADGRIVYQGKTFEDRFLGKETLKISIFMSVFNVHVNRIPFPAEVDSIHYEKGRFFSADLDKASRENEQNAIVLRVPDGEKIVVVQVAGLVARRIDCWLQSGTRVQRGERFGMIRFGSRLDLFVPSESHSAVKIGQRVKAGESILCYYLPSEESRSHDR